jgi:hypothetical protein
MPYLKNKDLELYLKYYYLAGCVTGYGFDHELSLTEQEEKAFEEYHNKTKIEIYKKR